MLVKTRALEWCLAADLICSDKAKWWNLNPMGVITASWTQKKQQYTVSDTDLVAFIDSSFNSQVRGSLKGGVGGLVNLQNENKVLEFSGPAKVSSAVEAEEQALFTLLQILHDHIQSYFGNFTSLTIFSDNQELIKDFASKKLIALPASSLSIKLKYISRIYNQEADSLAKRGMSSDSLIITCA